MFSKIVTRQTLFLSSLDLQLKKLDPKVQSETVERNKLAWDKLVANAQREKNNLRLLKEGWPVKNIPSGAHCARLDSSDADSSEKSSVISASTTESDSSDLMSIASSDKMSVESTEDAEGAEVPNSRDILSVGDMPNYVIEPSLILNANLISETDNINNLLLDNDRALSKLETLETAGSVNEKPSLMFPCIIEALDWAGQGRDPTVKVLDSQAIPQPISPFLRDATHIQILATGSLNFVGGVLDVLTSISGDVYS